MWASATRSASRGSSVEYDAPPPPCTWVSTKPGVIVMAGKERAGVRDGLPSPTATTLPPPTSTQPGVSCRDPVITLLALIRALPPSAGSPAARFMLRLGPHAA